MTCLSELFPAVAWPGYNCAAHRRPDDCPQVQEEDARGVQRCQNKLGGGYARAIILDVCDTQCVHKRLHKILVVLLGSLAFSGRPSGPLTQWGALRSISLAAAQARRLLAGGFGSAPHET